MKEIEVNNLFDYGYVKSGYSLNLKYWRACKIEFLDYEKPTGLFYFALIKTNKTNADNIVEYLHKLEDKLKIERSKIEVYITKNERNKKYYIFKIEPDQKWFYNRITLSLLLESLRSTFKRPPQKLIDALAKYGIENYLNKDLSDIQRWNNEKIGLDWMFLCNALSSKLDENLQSPSRGYSSICINKNFHRKTKRQLEQEAVVA